MGSVNEHSVMTPIIIFSAPHMTLTLLLSISLEIFFIFFLPVAYTQVLIWSYIKTRLKLHEMAKHQGNRELSTTLQCCFSISEALKRYYCSRNSHKAEREKENNIFKSQLEGVN